MYTIWGGGFENRTDGSGTLQIMTINPRRIIDLIGDGAGQEGVAATEDEDFALALKLQEEEDALFQQEQEEDFIAAEEVDQVVQVGPRGRPKRKAGSPTPNVLSTGDHEHQHDQDGRATTTSAAYLEKDEYPHYENGSRVPGSSAPGTEYSLDDGGRPSITPGESPGVVLGRPPPSSGLFPASSKIVHTWFTHETCLNCAGLPLDGTTQSSTGDLRRQITHQLRGCGHLYCFECLRNETVVPALESGAHPVCLRCGALLDKKDICMVADVEYRHFETIRTKQLFDEALGGTPVGSRTRGTSSSLGETERAFVAGTEGRRSSLGRGEGSSSSMSSRKVVGFDPNGPTEIHGSSNSPHVEHPASTRLLHPRTAASTSTREQPQPADLHRCPLCFDDWPRNEGVTLTCGHFLCEEDFFLLLQSKIQEGTVADAELNCPIYAVTK